MTLATIVWVGGLGVVTAGRLGQLGPDGPVDRSISSLDDHLHVPAQAVAGLSQPVHFAILVAAVLAVCAAVRSARAAAAFLGSIAVTLVGVEVIKELVRRRMVIPHYQFLSSYTFPSGHAAAATVVVTIVVLICRRDGPAGRYLARWLRVAATITGGVIVAAVSASEIMIRDHYLTDAAAAIPLALTVTLLVAAAVDWLVLRHPSRW